MKNLSFATVLCLLAACQFSKKEQKQPPTAAVTLPVDTTPLPCCQDMKIGWKNLDSMENWLPPLDECEPSVSVVLKILKAKQAEIRRLEPLRRQFGFSENCIFYEYKKLKTRQPRAIAVVIENPRFQIDLEDYETCPTEVFGQGYVCGRVSFALLDPNSKSVLDTCPEISYESPFEPRCHTLPFSIRAGRSYRSDGSNDGAGRVRILTFSDFNRDGIAAEFPIFEYVACGFNVAAIIGYDQRRDQILPFVFNFSATEKDFFGQRDGRDTTFSVSHNWMPNLPFAALLKKDTFRYHFYGGHGMETGEVFKIWFNPATGEFDGTLQIVSGNYLFENGEPFEGSGSGRAY